MSKPDKLPIKDKYGIYTDQYVLDVLERLSAYTCDDVQSRIQDVYMWLARKVDRERK